MSRLAVYLLGPPRLERDGKSVQVSRRKVMALLAYLAVTGQSHSRETLVTLLSPELDQSRARSEFRRTLSVLNSLLGEGYVAADRESVRLNPDADPPLWLDVAHFRQRLAAGDTHDHPPDIACPECVPLLEEAVELYRDDFMAGFNLSDSLQFEEWQFFQAEGLRNQLAAALQRLVRWYDSQGEYEPAIVYARRWSELDPTNEPTHRQLMQLYARAGRRAAALRQYELCRQLLADELGVEAAAATTALYEQILAGVLDVSAPALQTIRGYELRERIGSGGFGEVYRAYQPSVGREVAIKVILPQYANQPDFVRRFEREAQLVARLEHPHIVPLYDYWRQRNGAYLVMRWLRGGSLRQALQRGPWSPQGAARLLDQLAAALSVAHRQGVVHRDVKPENILLDEEGNAYLTDFGIAKELLRATATTGTGAIPGSLAYIAPEQAQSQAVTPQSDLYGLGVVMHEVLTGKHPFAGMTPADQLVKHLTEPLPPLRERRPDLPTALEGVIQRATAKDPAGRYPDVIAFAEAFGEALSTAVGEVVTALSEPEIPLRLPAFLDEAAQPVAGIRPVFVGRERELERLDAYLEAALAGRRQVAFVTGGPGRGKTALMEAFARRVMETHPELLVAMGNCNAYSGVGDPYLPFRAVLGMLTGDLEAGWMAGAITREQAQRMWAGLPFAVGALLNHGAALIDIFVSGASLLSRASVAAEGAGWLERLQELTEREKAQPGDLAQSHLFEGYTNVLGALAARHPLLLILDDLQWADSASISLLFHLGRELASDRILIVGAYRPEEVALGRDGERHPLEKVLTEFKRDFGDVWVDLSGVDELEGRRFVDTFLDTELNRLGEDFRRALFQSTAGHPLFTVELLREMQERGDLVRDEGGRWIEGRALDWGTLPVRVEAVIEERVGRLRERLQDILTLASVEGEEFTAQVVSRLGDIPERDLLRVLSQELGARHRLVREGGEVQIARAGRFLARYRFTHALFQGYLYNRLSAGERRLLHGEVAEALEELYVERIEEITVQLAHHYAEAGKGEKAVDYLLRAGDQARLAYACQEASGYYQRALPLLEEQGEQEQAARTLMKLGLTYDLAFDFQRARQAYERGFALWQRAAEARWEDLPPAPHPLRLLEFEPTSLDPTVTGDTLSAPAINHLFSGLMELRPDMEVVPDVAQSWEILEGGRKYLFHLRDDVRWSDGTPVTAGDFEYAWKRVLNPALGDNALAILLYDVKGARAFHQGEVSDPDSVGVQALDEVTLAVELEGPTGYFLYLLAYSATFPVPRHVVELHGEAWAEPENILTCGPFRLEVWQPGELMTLTRNPDYHGWFTGNLECVELLLPDMGRAAILEMFEWDRLDLLDLVKVAPSEVDRVRQRYAGEYRRFPELQTTYVGFDASRPPFDDVRVRRAFVLAADREALVKAIGPDIFLAASGFVPPGMPGHSPGIGLPHDPGQARQLLAEAGYPGGQGFPVVECLNGPPMVDYGENLQAQWKKNLGVQIKWEIIELHALLDRLNEHVPHLYLLIWLADYPDPDNFLRVGIGVIQQRCRWRNEGYDSLVEQARRSLDQGERMKLYGEAERILAQEAPIMPILHQSHRFLVKRWVTRLPMTGLRGRFFKDVIIKPH